LLKVIVVHSESVLERIILDDFRAKIVENFYKPRNLMSTITAHEFRLSSSVLL
jgi:hypothetical protein